MAEHEKDAPINPLLLTASELAPSVVAASVKDFGADVTALRLSPDESSIELQGFDHRGTGRGVKITIEFADRYGRY